MSWVILRHKKLDKFKGKVNSKDLAIELYALEDKGLEKQLSYCDKMDKERYKQRAA